MTMQINACGLSCPEPVVLALNAIHAQEDSFIIQVDNQTALENVQRLAVSKKYLVEITEDEDEIFILRLYRQ